MVNNKFKVGEKVYQVCCGDAAIGIVAQFWELPDNPMEVGYSVKGGLGGCFWNPDIGKTIFKKPQDAAKAAVEFIKTHDCILAKNMKVVERQDFSGKNYHNTPTVFCVLSNGMMYVKDNYQFAHLVDYGDVFAAKEALYKIKQKKILEGETKVAPTTPLKNMYRCEKTKDGRGIEWCYAEAGYGKVIGSPQNWG